MHRVNANGGMPSEGVLHQGVAQEQPRETPKRRVNAKGGTPSEGSLAPGVRQRTIRTNTETPRQRQGRDAKRGESCTRGDSAARNLPRTPQPCELVPPTPLRGPTQAPGARAPLAPAPDRATHPPLPPAAHPIGPGPPRNNSDKHRSAASTPRAGRQARESCTRGDSAARNPPRTPSALQAPNPRPCEDLPEPPVQGLPARQRPPAQRTLPYRARKDARYDSPPSDRPRAAYEQIRETPNRRVKTNGGMPSEGVLHQGVAQEQPRETPKRRVNAKGGRQARESCTRGDSAARNPPRTPSALRARTTHAPARTYQSPRCKGSPRASARPRNALAPPVRATPQPYQDAPSIFRIGIAAKTSRSRSRQFTAIRGSFPSGPRP